MRRRERRYGSVVKRIDLECHRRTTITTTNYYIYIEAGIEIGAIWTESGPSIVISLKISGSDYHGLFNQSHPMLTAKV